MKHIGWIIVDKFNLVYNFIPLECSMIYGVSYQNEKPDNHYLAKLDYEFAGMSPFTVKEVFTND